MSRLTTPDSAVAARRAAAVALDDLRTDCDSRPLRASGRRSESRSARGCGRCPLSPTPSARSRSSRSAVVTLLPIAPMQAAGVSSAATMRRNVELLVVGAARRSPSSQSTGAPRRNAVGPVDDELVGLREARGRDEPGAGVADRDAVPQQLADARQRRGVVDRAEDVTSAVAAGASARTPRRRRHRRARSRRPRAVGQPEPSEPSWSHCSPMLSPLAVMARTPPAGRTGRPRRGAGRASCRARRSGSRPCRRTRARPRAASSSAMPYSRTRAGAAVQHLLRLLITAGSTQPPVTDLAISPRSFRASDAPGSRGAEPRRSTTVASATRRPSACQPRARWE